MPPPLHRDIYYSFSDTNPLQIRTADNQDPGTRIHNSISIPSTYGRIANPPNPGVIVGATLGAVAGFLLLLYLLYLGLTSGRRFSASTISGSTVTSRTPEEIVDVGFGRRRPFGRPQGRGKFGGGARRGRGDDPVVVEENLTDSRSGRGGGGGGVVEVIEEESVVDPPPSSRYRSHSRSRSRSSSSSESSRSRPRRYRRDGGVRGVDPMAYGGGSEFSGRS